MLSLFYFPFPVHPFLQQPLFPIIPFGIMFSQSRLSACNLSVSGIMVFIISSYKVSCHKKVNCFYSFIVYLVICFFSQYLSYLNQLNGSHLELSFNKEGESIHKRTHLTSEKTTILACNKYGYKNTNIESDTTGLIIIEKYWGTNLVIN